MAGTPELATGPSPAGPSQRLRGSAPAPVWLAVGVTLAALLLGWMVKAQCTTNAWADSFQYRRLCYNDLQPLFGVRGIEQGDVPYVDQPNEYPVLTGTFMHLAGKLLRAVEGWGEGAGSAGVLVAALLLAGAGIVLALSRRGRPGPGAAAGAGSLAALTAAGVLLAVWSGGVRANDNADYFHLSAILLAPFALATSIVLRPVVTWERLLLWAGGLPLVLYAFHNWDLIAVAGAVAGLVAFERGWHGWAGAGLGLGAAAKLYPGFLLPGAVLSRLAAQDRPGAGRVVLGAALVGGGANLYWLVRSPSGWFETWLFHGRRYPDFGTVWYWLAHHGRRLVPSPGWDPAGPGGESWYMTFVSVASLVLFAGGTVWFLLHGWRRRSEPDGYPVAAIGLGIVALFLLVSKVHSPQYALWVVPLLALLDVPWRYVGFYFAGDAAVFVSGFYYFTVMTNQAPGWMGIFELAVLARAAALALLVWYAARAVRLHPDLPGGEAPAEAGDRPLVPLEPVLG